MPTRLVHLVINAVEQARLALGAAPINIAQGDVSWAVLADPEGSEFCVLSPRGSRQ